MKFNESEYHALISLLDDDDKEVLEHVVRKIESIGTIGLPVLQNYINSDTNARISEKCEELVQKIHFSEIYQALEKWNEQLEGDLLQALLLIAKVKYPSLDTTAVTFQVERIVQRIWLRIYQSQSNFEQIQVINYALFRELDIEVKSVNEAGDIDAYLIHSILETKRSNSFGLCLLYMIIAQSLDLPLYHVQLPYNSVLLLSRRWFSQSAINTISIPDDILFYVNPLHHGNTFPVSEIEDYLRKNKLNFNESFFRPVTNKEILKHIIHAIIQSLDKEDEALRKLYEQLGELFE